MTRDELRTLRRALAILREPRRFFYCPEGADGFPVLLVNRRLQPRQLLAVRRWAKTKIFIRGRVERVGESLLFIPDGTRHIDLLAQDLAGFFTENLPGVTPMRLLSVAN